MHVYLEGFAGRERGLFGARIRNKKLMKRVDGGGRSLDLYPESVLEGSGASSCDATPQLEHYSASLRVGERRQSVQLQFDQTGTDRPAAWRKTSTFLDVGRICRYIKRNNL